MLVARRVTGCDVAEVDSASAVKAMAPRRVNPKALVPNPVT
jgi:hypothetical protein